MSNENISSYNFDHPDAFDTDLRYEHLLALKSGKPKEMPQYDFVLYRRKDVHVPVEPKKLIILEGLMILFDQRIRELLDLKLFVDTPDDVRFIRRLRRDVEQRGRTVDSVINQYLDMVRPGHYDFIEPTKIYADMIIPESGYNEKALNVLTPFIRDIS